MRLLFVHSMSSAATVASWIVNDTLRLKPDLRTPKECGDKAGTKLGFYLGPADVAMDACCAFSYGLLAVASVNHSYHMQLASIRCPAGPAGYAACGSCG